MKTQLISYNEVNDAFEKVTKGKYYKPGNDSTTRPPEQETDVQSESELRDYLTGAFTVEDLRHALYDEREKTSQAIRKLVAQRDELLAAAKEARMALTLDYHGTTRPKKALCDVSAAASQAHNQIVLAIAKCEANK